MNKSGGNLGRWDPYAGLPWVKSKNVRDSDKQYYDCAPSLIPLTPLPEVPSGDASSGRQPGLGSTQARGSRIRRVMSLSQSNEDGSLKYLPQDTQGDTTASQLPAAPEESSAPPDTQGGAQGGTQVAAAAPPDTQGGTQGGTQVAAAAPPDTQGGTAIWTVPEGTIYTMVEALPYLLNEEEYYGPIDMSSGLNDSFEYLDIFLGLQDPSVYALDATTREGNARILGSGGNVYGQELGRVLPQVDGNKGTSFFTLDAIAPAGIALGVGGLAGALMGSNPVITAAGTGLGALGGYLLWKYLSENKNTQSWINNNLWDGAGEHMQYIAPAIGGLAGLFLSK